MKNTITYLTKQELDASMSIKDLTDNTNGVHAINLIMNDILDKIYQRYQIEPIIVRNNPIVKSVDNYENLYYPTDDITKSSRYTRWIDEEMILRTQTTSGIPNLLKNITLDDGIYMLPGLVYRRDVINRTHVGEPHQLDIWRISNKKLYDRQDLLELVDVVISSIMPNTEWRYNETSHYYTKDGIEVEVLKDGKWLEILECGLILPKLLDDNVLDSKRWSGLAMGIGLDRSVMLRKDISDIRMLRSEDVRIKSQMCNLDKYKEVSPYPNVCSDISISVMNDMDEELLGDEIRNNVPNAEWIEEIVVKSETSYDKLPEHVRERLGMESNMKNLLIRIKMCALDRTLSREDVNQIIKDLYGKVHKGSVGYL